MLKLQTMINECYRVGRVESNCSRRIVVEFTNHVDKIKILNSRKVIRNFLTKKIGMEPDVPIYIRENLTMKSSKLFKEARYLQKQCNYQFLWTKNGLGFLC